VQGNRLLDFLRCGWSFDQRRTPKLLRKRLLDIIWNFLVRIDFAEIAEANELFTGQAHTGGRAPYWPYVMRSTVFNV
jgi:hypothetical protein